MAEVYREILESVSKRKNGNGFDLVTPEGISSGIVCWNVIRSQPSKLVKGVCKL